MGYVDLRNEKRIRPLKGPAGNIEDEFIIDIIQNISGSVRCIASHPDSPHIIAAVGLDRHIHVFDTKTCKRKQKVNNSSSKTKKLKV